MISILALDCLKTRQWLCLLLFTLTLQTEARTGSLGDRTLTAKLGITATTLEMESKPRPPLSAQTLKYKPHAPSRTFLSLAYDWMSASISAVNPLASDQDLLYGESKATDYLFRFYFERWTTEFFYQRYKGYYIDNTQDVIPNWSKSQPRRLYPDLTTEHVGFSTTYIFSPETYSMAASFDQSVIQKESGGSWLLNVSGSDHRIRNSSALIPSELTASYGEFGNVQSGRMFTASLGAGFGYNFIFLERGYLAASLIVNAGLQNLKYQKIDGSELSEQRSSTQAHIKAGIGYNADQFLAGFSLANDTAGYQIENVEMNFQTLEIAVFVGTRFGR